MTINYSKQVLVKRGNTAVSSTYTGPLGEITLDTDLHQLRLHDGVTAGGWLVPSGQDFANIQADISTLANIDVEQLANISSLLNSVSTLANIDVEQLANISTLFSNAVSQQESIQFLLDNSIEYVVGNTTPTGNETLWFHTDEGRLYAKENNVWVDANPAVLPTPSYIYGTLQNVAGNIIPDSTNTYSLGSPDAQWKDLWVSNATIYLNSVPLGVDVTGNLTFNGDPIVSYVDGNLSVGGTVVSGGGSGTSITDGYYSVVTDNTGIHLNAGGVSLTYDDNDLITFTGMNPTFKFDNNIVFNSPGYNKTWAFNYSGQTTIPGTVNGVEYLSLNSTTFSDLRWYNTSPTVAPNNKLNANVRANNEGVRISNRGFDGATQEVNNHWLFGFDANVTLPSGGSIGTTYGDAGSAGLQAGPGGYAIINSNDRQQYVQADNTAVYIGTGWPDNNHNWTFGTDGNLTVPGALHSSTGSLIFVSNTANPDSFWTIGNLDTTTSALIAPNSPDSKAGVIILPTPTGIGQIAMVGQISSPWDDSLLLGTSGNIVLSTGLGDYEWRFGTDGKLTVPGQTLIANNTNSINTTTGALVVTGGVGIQNDVHIGGTVNITDTTPSTDYTTGALVVNGGVGVNGNINLSGNINILSGNINIQEFTGSTGNFYGDITTGFNAFYAGKTGFTPLPYTVAQFSTNSNTYSQINMENTSTGKLASVDFVGTGDIGTDSSWFFDIGIANSGYDPVLAAQNNALGTSIGPLDSYIYVQGNVDIPDVGGNLTIGTSQTGKVVKFIAGGTNAADVILTIGQNGVVVTQNLTAPNMAYAADVLAANAAIASAAASATDAIGAVNTAMIANVAAANAAIITANSAAVSYVNTLNTAMASNVAAANAAIITANTAMKSYVDAQIAAVPGGGGSTYSNANVVAYYTSSNSIAVGSGTAQHLLANATSVVVGNLTALYNGGSFGVVASQLTNNIGYYANSQPYALRTGAVSYLNQSSGVVTMGASGITTAGAIPSVATVFNAGSNFFNIFQPINLNSTANIIATNMAGQAMGITGNITHTGSNFVTSSNITVAGNITVNGTGGVKMPNLPAFRIYGGTPAWWTTANTNFKGASITVDYNQGSYFNSTTGVFTAPIAGLYHTTLNARVGSVNAQGQIMVVKNGLTTPGNVAVMWEADTNTGTAVHFGVTSVIKLAAGDILTANITAGNIQFDQNDSWTVTYLG